MEKLKNLDRRWLTLIIGSVAALVIGLDVYKYAVGKALTLSDVISIPIVLMFFIEFLTWGKDSALQKDEMGQRIIMLSAKISYFVMIAALFVLWIVDRIYFVRKDEFGNMTLFFALCLSMIILPLVQYFVARRYR